MIFDTFISRLVQSNENQHSFDELLSVTLILFSFTNNTFCHKLGGNVYRGAAKTILVVLIKSEKNLKEIMAQYFDNHHARCSI